MLGLKVINHALRSRIVLIALNLALVLLILLQCAYLYLHSSPEFLRDWVEEKIRVELAASGLDLSVDKLEIRKQGSNVRVGNLTLRQTGQTGTIAVLKEVRLEIDPLSLIAGSLSISQLEVRGGILNCPALISPSGAEETLLQDLRATLQPHENDWALRNFSFRLHNARVTGVFHDDPPLLLRMDKDIKTRGLPKRFQKALADLLRTRPRLAALDAPVITLKSLQDEQVYAQLQAKGLQIPELLTSERLSLETRLQREPGHLLFTAPIKGRLENALLKKKLRVTNLHFQLPAPSTELSPTLFPLEVKLSTGPIQIDAELAGRFIGKARMEDPSHLAMEGVAGFHHSFTTISASANLEKKTAQIQTRFHIHPGDVPKLQAFIPRKHLKQAQLREPMEGNLHARFDEDWKLSWAEFALHSRQLEILEVPLADLRVRGTYVPGRLEVPEVFAQFKPGDVSGSFHQDLKTGDYRFLLDGRMFPGQLNPWFKTWWDDLWARFNFTGLPMYANIDIGGRWNDLTRRNIYGAGKIISASYRGIPFEEAQGILRCIPRYTEFFGLDARFPDGHAKGQLAWILHPKERNRITSRRFNLQGKLSLDTASKLFGDRVQKVLADFTSEEPPEIKADGVIFGHGNFDYLEKQPVNQFFVRSRGGKSTFLSIPVDFLEIDLESQAGAITIDPVKFGFAKGKGNGWLKHRHNPDGPPMEFSMELKDADKDLVLQHLARNPKLNLKPPKATKEKSELKSFRLHATGNHGDITSFNGNGSFSLQDPSLAKVNILGLLFKELKNLPLPLISYRFDRMESDFKLQEELMVFGPEPLKILGPTSKVDATGNLNIKTRELNFKVRLLPLGLPFARFLEMNLGGTIEKPAWKSSSNTKNDLQKIKPTPGKPEPFKRLDPNKNSLPIHSKKPK